MIKTLVAMMILLAATPAFACPQCALNERGGLGSWFMLPAMILFPFILVGGVLYVLRRTTTILATEQENLDVS